MCAAVCRLLKLWVSVFPWWSQIPENHGLTKGFRRCLPAAFSSPSVTLHVYHPGKTDGEVVFKSVIFYLLFH